MTSGAGPYFRDLYDHLIRISDLVDSYRDLLGGVDGHPPLHGVQPAQRGHEAAHGHRHRVPTLSFLTGFFGQNFAWLVNRIGSLARSGLGLGTELAIVAGMLLLFRRRGWL